MTNGGSTGSVIRDLIHPAAKVTGVPLIDEFYTVKEVAQILKCSKNKVYDLLRKKKIKYLPLGDMKRIPREEIERLKAGE